MGAIPVEYLFRYTDDLTLHDSNEQDPNLIGLHARDGSGVVKVTYEYTNLAGALTTKDATIRLQLGETFYGARFKVVWSAGTTAGMGLVGLYA